MTERPNVVLIHGAFADGSSWRTVVEHLQARGHDVTAPQFPLTSLADDVARLRQALAWQTGPTVVVGHSYGGQVMTALGDDTANVVGLVYVAAFGLETRASRSPPWTLTHRPRRRSRTSSSTSSASAGCPRTTSCATSRPTSTRSRRGSCTRPSSRSR